MTTRSPEDLLRETLLAKAGDAAIDLTVDDIRRSARARQRRSGRTALLVAAAVVVAVGAPTAFLLRPSGDATGPTRQPTSTSSPTPHEPTTNALDALPYGSAPGIAYLQDGTVSFPDGSSVRLPDPTAPVEHFTSYHGGWLVAVGGGAARVRWYDNTGTMRSDGPAVPILAVSEDGTRTAYPQSGAIHIGTSSGMGEDEQTLSGNTDQLWPVGFLRGGALVYEAGERTVAIQDGPTLSRMAVASAVSAAADLIAGDDPDGNTIVLTGDGQIAWTSTTWAVSAFSTDGRYAAATSRNSPTGDDSVAVAILDARTGRVLAQHALPKAPVSVGPPPVMDVDGSLLVAVTDGNTLEETVLRLDRDGALTRSTPVFPLDGASDATYVVFATRP